MGRHKKYDDKFYEDLLNLTLKELQSKYPEENKNNLNALKRYHRKKNMEQEGRLYKTWETSAYDKEAGEWVTTTNHGYEYGPSAEVFEPATPAKITPTKRKRAQEIGNTILVFGDSQIGYHRVYDEDGNDELLPIHSEEALRVICQVNAQLMPKYVVNLSDTVDNGELSRFQPQSDSFHRTLGPSYQRAHDFYAQLRADNPDSQITEVDSNHTVRPIKRMMEKYPEWYSFTLPGEKYPMMSYYRLANLEPLGINFISGYGAAEYVYGTEYDTAPIVFKHGNHSSSSPGATVRKEAGQNPTTNIVRGHGHSYEHIAQTTRDGEVLHYIQLGTTCQTTGNVPSYHSAMTDRGYPVHNQENWQNQFMVITDVNGRYQFDVVDIINGVATYRGIKYDGNE